MSMKQRRRIYRGGEQGEWRRRFVRTGQFRAPDKHEFYLSGGPPEVWRAPNDLLSPFQIMRPATDAESRCECCGHEFPVQS